MSFIIDRRRNAKNKSAINRKRFLDRYKHHVKEAVADAVNKRSITDMERGEDVSIPANDISEPVFQHGPGGRRSVVHPGNKEFSASTIPKVVGGMTPACLQAGTALYGTIIDTKCLTDF